MHECKKQNIDPHEDQGKKVLFPKGKMLEDPEGSVKAPADHGLVDTLGTFRTLEKKGSDKIGVRLVGTKPCSRFKSPGLHGIDNLMVLHVNDMDIAEAEEKEMDKFVGYPQVVQPMHQAENGRGGKQYHGGQHDRVGLNGNIDTGCNSLP